MVTNKDWDGKEMSDNEYWVCGDCGTQYPPDIHGCVNPDLDRLAIIKRNEGRQQEAQNKARQIIEILEAVNVLSRYGQVTVTVAGDPYK